MLSIIKKVNYMHSIGANCKIGVAAATLLLLGLLLQPPTLVQSEEVPERFQTLHFDGFIGKDVAPDNHNPLVPGGAKRDAGLHQLCWEYFFYFNLHEPDLEKALVPWLATGYEYNEDFTELTVFLREGVEWSDGEPFTAEDVAFTYNEIYLPEENKDLTHAAGIQLSVDYVEVVDDHTVIFHLLIPDDRFHMFHWRFPTVMLWGAPPILPKHVWEPVVEAGEIRSFKWTDVIGTGPYRLVSAESELYVWELRDDWWGIDVLGITPEVKRVVGYGGLTREALAMKFALGDIDVSFYVPPALALEIPETNPYIRFWSLDPPYSWEDPYPRYIGVNHMVYPWSEVEARWALSYLINRTEIVETVYLGTRKPAGFPLPGYGVLKPYLDALDELYAELKAEDPYLDPFLYDPDKAAEIFRGLGYELGPDGIWTHPDYGPLKATLVTYEEEDLVALVADQLRAGGIDVVWATYPSAVYGDFRNRATVEMWYHHGGTVFDPHEIVSRWHSRELLPVGEYAMINYERYLYPDGNPELDALIEAMEASTPLDRDTYVPLFKDAAEIIIRDRIVIPLVTTTFMLPYNTEYWTNWPLEDNPYMVPAIWWATALPMIVQLKSTYVPPPAAPPPPPPYGLYAATGAAVFFAGLSGYLAIRLRRRSPPS